MGQQISAAAESVGSGAASSPAGLAYSATGMAASSESGGLASMSLGPSQSAEATSLSRGDRNNLSSPSKQQLGGQSGQPGKQWTPASLDSFRAYPPLPKPPSVSTACSSGAGNPVDVSAGPARSADQGESQQGGEMELGKMSIREAIDSFIERCLHNSNDGGASDNDSSEESHSSQHHKATAGNIFALENSSKKSPSSSSHSPAHPLRDKDCMPSAKREKDRACGAETRTSRDSGSSSSSPKPQFDRGESNRPVSGQQDRGDKMSLERMNSNGDGGRDGKGEAVVASELVMKVDPSLDEGEDTVLVIDCEREDDKDAKEKKSPRGEDHGKSSPAKRESVALKSDLADEPSVKEEHKPEPADGKLVKRESDDAKDRCSDKTDDQNPEQKNSPSHQSRGNLLLSELSKKSGGLSSSPSPDVKSARSAPFLPGHKHLQFIIDRVLDSTLNDSCESSKTTKVKEELGVKSEKKASSPKETDSKVEIIKVEDPVRMDALDFKGGRKEKSEKNSVKEHMAHANGPVCIKDHIEKVLLESFLSYEEEERKEAMQKAHNSSQGLSAEGKSLESGKADVLLSKSMSSAKNAISVQDIVDRVITQTEAINKNMSGSSCASDGNGEGHALARHNSGGARDISLYQSSSLASRSHPSAASSSATTASERGYSSSSYHQHPSQHPHLHHPQQQQQQQHSASQLMSSQDKALQEAQRHVVLKEHQTSTTTGRKRGRPRRVSPSTSSNNHPPPHGGSVADYRLSAVGAGHHYPDDRARSGHLPHHGTPVDYNPHGSLSFGLPPGVPGILPPPGSASLMRQHQHQMEQQRQQHVKELHGHGLHGTPSSAGTYPPPGPRGHPREAVPHHMDMHHSRSHLPHHQQNQAGVSGGNGSSSSGASGGGIKAPPPLILAESISPATRLVPVSHIPTKSCSCHSCLAHFSGPTPTAAPPDASGSAASQHARLVQHQQNLRSGSASTRHEGRENSRSPHHLPSHAHHSHHAYGATGPYPVASPPSSSASSRHSLPPSAKDYYNPAHAASRGGECLRPVAAMPSRGLPPQAIIPTFVAAQRQQHPQRDPGPESLAAPAQSPNHLHNYPRDGSHPRFYDSKSSPAPTASPSSAPSAYQQYPASSQHHHGPSPNHHNPPHPQLQPHPQPRHPSPSSQHHKHVDSRYPPEHESSRHHPDYNPSSASNTSGPAYHRYDQRSMRDLGPGPSAHPGSNSSSLRGPTNLPPPGGAARSLPAPVEPDADAPLDLSVKPSRKPLEQVRQGSTRLSTEAASTHRASSGPHGPAGPPGADPDHQHSRAYRRHSLEVADTRPGPYKHPGDYREPVPGSHQPHYLQTLENSVDRILPHSHHHRSPYQRPHHSQQQQQQHSQPAHHPPPPHSQQHQPPAPHLRVSVSPQGQRSNPEPPHAGAPHPMDNHHQERPSGYSTSARPQHSPGQQRGYPPHVYPPTGGHTGSLHSTPGMYPHYPLPSSSPSMPQHPHAPHPHHAQAPLHQPPPQLPPPQPAAPQHYPSQQSQHQSKSGSSTGSGSSSNVNSNRGTAPSPSSQSYYNRSPVLGRPQTVSPASAGGPHHYPKTPDSSPHPPYPHGAFPPPQPNSPFQRPPSHNQDGENSRPSPVNSSHLSAGLPPPLTRRPSDTPSPDEEELDAQGKLNISKHEPIQNIIGSHSPGDILYLICRLCRQTYGNPYGFRKHFRKEHGFEPKAEHTVVQTISATKNAMAHPAPLDHMDGSRGINSGGPDKPSINELQSHHVDNHPHAHSNQPYQTNHHHSKLEDTGTKHYTPDHRNPESLLPSKRSEVLKDQKLLECAECSQTFQLNDFGAYKRHCRQHSGGSGAGPFLCHDCHKCFSEPDQLQEHLNTHADFTPSVCGICLTPFSAPDYLAEHLKAAHGHTAASGGSSSYSSAGHPGSERGELFGRSGERKPNSMPDGVQPSKQWGPSPQHQHSSRGMALSMPSSGAFVSSSWSASTASSLAVQSSRRTPGEISEPQHPVVHTPRDLQIEKLPADPAVMTASPDSSYTDEKLCADSQTSKTGVNSSPSVADGGPAGSKQQERDLDSNSLSPSRSRETPSMRALSSPPGKQPRESSSSHSHTPTPQPLPQSKPGSHQSDSAKSKEDNESISSDRCASVDSNSLSFEGSRTSSPAPDEMDFSYKHKKYSRYNRKRSTETSSLSGEPGLKSARSSSADSNSAASTPVTTSGSSVAAFSTATLSHPGGKNEHNLSPVVTSSASNARDCESSTMSSSYASVEDSGRSNSPATKTSTDSSGSPEAGKKADDPQSKRPVSLEENLKGVKSCESSKKRKAEDSEEKSEGKRCSGNSAGAGSDSTSLESGKFKWERMTRSQMGKTSQSVSYSSSS